MADNEEEHSSPVERSAAGPSSDLTARMDLMLQAMQQMREEMKAGQEETALKLARGARRDPYSFRRKGNENQFRFCEDVEDQLQSAAASMLRAERGAGKEALSRAKSTIEKGIELLSRRKKLIKLVDRSEAGWAFVEEYVEDDLAEDSDDERRIEKAERAAEKKLAKRKRERDATTRRTVGRQNERTEPLDPDSKRPHRAKEPTPLVPFKGSAPGACHQCGEFGHWRRDCPKRTAAGPTYPLFDVGSGGGECVEDTCFGVKGECKGYGGVELKAGDSSLSHHGTVKGRLQSCMGFWKEELCAPPWVLNTLEQGYVLPFTSVPAPFFHTNQHSANVNEEFVTGTVAELVAGGC